MCLDYDNSLDEQVIKTKELKKRLDKAEQKMRLAQESGTKMSANDERESKEVLDELIDLS